MRLLLVVLLLAMVFLAVGCGGGDGLSAAQIGEVGVELTLHATVGVELGLAVPQQDEPADRHSPTSGSSGVAPCRSTGTVGQSRQSRSKP